MSSQLTIEPSPPISAEAESEYVIRARDRMTTEAAVMSFDLILQKQYCISSYIDFQEHLFQPVDVVI